MFCCFLYECPQIRCGKTITHIYQLHSYWMTLKLFRHMLSNWYNCCVEMLEHGLCKIARCTCFFINLSNNWLLLVKIVGDMEFWEATAIGITLMYPSLLSEGMVLWVELLGIRTWLGTCETGGLSSLENKVSVNDWKVCALHKSARSGGWGDTKIYHGSVWKNQH